MPRPRRDPEPLSGLISTILSQQNTAPITRRQFAVLKAAFGTWQEALLADLDAVADTLRAAGGGLARTADYSWDGQCGYHVAMIRHGRETRRARAPSCPACVLRDLCPSAALFELGR